MFGNLDLPGKCGEHQLRNQEVLYGEREQTDAGEFALALEIAATLTDIAATIHAHPTLGETVQEVALKGLGRALHL